MVGILVVVLEGFAPARGGRSRRCTQRPQEGCRRPDGRLTCCVGHTDAERNAAGWRAQGSVRCGQRRRGDAGGQRRPAETVDRAMRDVHSVAWMLRRAVGRAGAERNAARAACPSVRCRQPGGPGRMQEAETAGSTVGRGMDSAMDAVWGWDRGYVRRRRLDVVHGST